MSRHVDDLLPAYLNGTIDPGERRRVDEHLTNCATCREVLAEWGAIASASRSLFAETSFPISDEIDRIWAAIDISADERPRARRATTLAGTTREEKHAMIAHTLSPQPYMSPKRVSPFAWLASGLVLMLMVGSFAWYSMEPGSGDTPQPMPAVQVASIGATQATSEKETCPVASVKRDLDVSGAPVISSVIQMPDGPYEGGFHVRPENLPVARNAPDHTTVDAISQTVGELTACMNAGDAPGTWALTTEDYVKRFAASGRNPLTVDARAIVPMVGPAVLETPIPDVRNSVLLEDGRVGAEIRPSFDGPPGSYDYYVFAEQDGRWLVDEAVHVQAFVQIEVTVDDSGFSPKKIAVPAQAAELVLNNTGTTTHSLVVPERGIRLEADPGERMAVVVKGPSGQSQFKSDIPGDDPMVFTGTITFEGESASMATPDVLNQETEATEIGLPQASATIHMTAPETYAPDQVAILADRDVELTLINDGPLDANFTIDALGISVDFAPGESTTVMVNAPEGVYAFYSTIPGHTAVGMNGVLFVQTESAQP